MRSRDIVIVGGGLAAQRCCEALRRGGHDAAIRIVCGEDSAPYDRPPLSKDVLAGGRAPETLRFRADSWYAEQDIDLLLGAPAVALDAPMRRLTLAGGSTVPYGRLVVATGACARRLATLDGRENVMVLRDLADALGLAGRLRPGAHVVIVGGGFIGLEVASTARSLGVDVTIVEAAPTPLAGPLGERLGGWFAGLHREEGVDVLTSARIACVHGRRSVAAIDLEDGRRLEPDTVLVAIGAVPDTSWLAASGLPVDGLPVDGRCATALADVYAAGDVARPADPVTGAPLRREHWEAAARTAAVAARSILGREAGPEPPAGFWSDQYGLRVQLVGEPQGANRVEIDGEPESRDFAATFWRGARPAAVLLVGRPAGLPAARRLVADSSSVPITPIARSAA